MTVLDFKISKPHTLSRRGEGPNPIDVHVGARLRLRRTLLGFSQETLGQAVGITFQQLQKYERGANRISASRLFNLSRVLDVSVAFFFDDIPESGFTGRDVDDGESSDTDDNSAMASRETLELVRAYYRIGDPSVRRRALDLIKALAGDGGDQGSEVEGIA